MSQDKKKFSSFVMFFITFGIIIVVAFMFLDVDTTKKQLQNQEKKISTSKLPKVDKKLILKDNNSTVITEANTSKNIKEVNKTAVLQDIPTKEILTQDAIELIKFETKKYADNTKRYYQRVLGEEFPLDVREIEDGWWGVFTQANEMFDREKIIRVLDENKIEIKK